MPGGGAQPAMKGVCVPAACDNDPSCEQPVDAQAGRVIDRHILERFRSVAATSSYRADMIFCQTISERRTRDTG